MLDYTISQSGANKEICVSGKSNRVFTFFTPLICLGEKKGFNLKEVEDYGGILNEKSVFYFRDTLGWAAMRLNWHEGMKLWISEGLADKLKLAQ